MPIYEFNCEDCNKDSEILVRFSEWKGHAKCPSCGSVKLEKKLSVFAASTSEGSSAEIPPVQECQVIADAVALITNRV